MKNVTAKIIFNHNEQIIITSKKAIYNTINYDTNLRRIYL